MPDEIDRPPDYLGLIRLVVTREVKFVIVGGVAMIFRGADYFTNDIDLCIERSTENAERICKALHPYSAQIRLAYIDMIHHFTEISKGEAFTTQFGRVDLLGEVSGLGDYADVMRYSTPIELEGLTLYVLTVDGLIKAKEAANRTKDQLHLVTLRALKELEDEENSSEA